MKDHFRFSVAYWHTFRGTGSDPFGPGTMLRPWEAAGRLGRERQAIACRVAFEFMEKLGVPFYASTIATSPPKGKTLAETQQEPRRRRQGAQGRAAAHRHQAAVGHRQPVQQSAATCTAPPPARNADAFAFAAAQVKKALEVTKELGGDGYTFWGGREGYQNLWNTDMKRELDHLAALPAHGRRLRQGDRLHRPVLHRAQAEGADQAPVRFRRGRLHQLPPRRTA